MPLIIVRLNLDDANLDIFEAYETQVLPLLANHGGALLRRRRIGPRAAEIHIIRFDALEGYEAYLSDRRRVALAPLRDQSGVRSKVRILPHCPKAAPEAR